MKTATIVANFSKCSASYDEHAQPQMHAANTLAQQLRLVASEIPSGPVLELGCGTGLLSNSLIDTFAAQHDVIISDLSEEMLELCRRRTGAVDQSRQYGLHFEVIDAEDFSCPPRFSLIISSFAFQWLSNLEATIGRLLSSLQPGGKLIFSVPCDGSFKEWQSLCRKTGVPYTGNPLMNQAFFADIAAQNLCASSFYNQQYTIKFDSALDFFRSIKRLGASTPLTEKRLSSVQFTRLLNFSEIENPHGFESTYDVLFGEITRPANK